MRVDYDAENRVLRLGVYDENNPPDTLAIPCSEQGVTVLASYDLTKLIGIHFLDASPEFAAWIAGHLKEPSE